MSSSSCIGGLEKLLYHLCRDLDETRFKTTLFLLAGEGPFVDLMQDLEHGTSATRVRIFDLVSPWRPTVWKALVQALRHGAPQVLHAFGLKGDVVSRWLAPALGRPPLFSTVANPDLSRPVLIRALNGVSAGRVEAFWADCEARARLGETHLGVPAGKIRVIYPGVGPVARARPEETRRAVCRELGIDPQVPVLAVLGDLRPIKGHLVVLEAAPAILERHPEAVFLFLGRDTTGGALPARAAASTAASHLRFLGFRSDPTPYIETADLLLQPSLSEGLPRAVLEAMLLETPVVASNVGGLPEVVEDGRNGCLIPPGDPAALALASVELLSHPERIRTLGAAARNLVEERFGLDRMLTEFEALYRQAWEKRRALRQTQRPTPDES